MSDSKRVTREDVIVAVTRLRERQEWPDDGYWDDARYRGKDGTIEAADAIFDALPTPPASRDVDADAYRDALVGAMPWYDEANPDYSELDALIAAHDAAIRAEGLDETHADCGGHCDCYFRGHER